MRRWRTALACHETRRSRYTLYERCKFDVMRRQVEFGDDDRRLAAARAERANDAGSQIAVMVFAMNDGRAAPDEHGCQQRRRDRRETGGEPGCLFARRSHDRRECNTSDLIVQVTRRGVFHRARKKQAAAEPGLDRRAPCYPLSRLTTRGVELGQQNRHVGRIDDPIAIDVAQAGRWLADPESTRQFDRSPAHRTCVRLANRARQFERRARADQRADAVAGGRPEFEHKLEQPVDNGNVRDISRQSGCYSSEFLSNCAGRPCGTAGNRLFGPPIGG